MYRYSMLLPLLAALCCFACEKEDNAWGLPPATQNGANTFGCLIDGKPWVANIAVGILDPTLRPLDMTYDETGTGEFYHNNWSVTAKRVNDSIGESIGISARKFDKALSLRLRPNGLKAYVALAVTGQFGFMDYQLDTLQPYKIEITKLDTLHNICSGRFEFVAITRDKKDTLHITQGRFDKKYGPE
jgi:hypothetical protein